MQCLALVAMRLTEAETLLAQGLPTQATILFTFAVEEFGKAVLLRRAFERSDETVALVEIEGFYDHVAKLEAAATEIPQQYLLVGHEGFQADAFATDAFQVGATAKEWKTRLGAMFVDWSPSSPDGLEGRWNWGVRTDPEVLRESIKGVQTRAGRASIEWLA